MRLLLAFLNSLALIFIRRSLSRAFAPLTGTLYAFLTVSQFHVPYWQGRTLPNMFALIPGESLVYLLSSSPDL